MNVITANSSLIQVLHITPSEPLIDKVTINGVDYVPAFTLFANWVELQDVFNISKGVYDIFCYNGLNEVYKGLIKVIDGNEILNSEIIFA